MSESRNNRATARRVMKEALGGRFTLGATAQAACDILLEVFVCLPSSEIAKHHAKAFADELAERVEREYASEFGNELRQRSAISTMQAYGDPQGSA